MITQKTHLLQVCKTVVSEVIKLKLVKTGTHADTSSDQKKERETSSLLSAILQKET